MKTRSAALDRGLGGLGLVVAFLVTLVAPTSALADDALVAFPKDASRPMGYVEYLPPGYSASTAHYPIVVFLHGLGEEGDGSSPLGPMSANGPIKIIAQRAPASVASYFHDHGVIVVAPQSPSWWSADQVELFLDWVVTKYRIDPSRVYLTGISMGGGGAWDGTERLAPRLAGVVPIAGASSGNATAGKAFVGTPVWAFHDFDDPRVACSNTIGWCDGIAANLGHGPPPVMTGYPHANGDTTKAATDTVTNELAAGVWKGWRAGVVALAGAPLTFTLYPTGGHDAWTKTYENKDVWDWLLAQRTAAPAGPSKDAIIVDNLDTRASFVGAWTRTHDVAGFYFWDVHQAAGGAGATARFAPSLASAGHYRVLVAYTPGPDRAVVTVDIATSSGTKQVTLDMKTGPAGFHDIGAFDLDPTSTVALSAPSGAVIADAVGFDLVPPSSVGGDAGGAPDAGTGYLPDGGAAASPGAGPPSDSASGSGAGCAIATCPRAGRGEHLAWLGSIAVAIAWFRARRRPARRS